MSVNTDPRKLNESQKDRLGRALQQARGDQSQGAVASVLGTNQSYISNIESGERTPSLGLLAAMCRVYDTSVSDVADKAGL